MGPNRRRKEEKGGCGARKQGADRYKILKGRHSAPNSSIEHRGVINKVEDNDEGKEAFRAKTLSFKTRDLERRQKIVGVGGDPFIKIIRRQEGGVFATWGERERRPSREESSLRKRHDAWRKQFDAIRAFVRGGKKSKS